MCGCWFKTKSFLIVTRAVNLDKQLSVEEYKQQCSDSSLFLFLHMQWLYKEGNKLLSMQLMQTCCRLCGIFL